MKNNNGNKFWNGLRQAWPILLVLGGALIVWATMCEKVDNISTKEIPALKEVDRELKEENKRAALERQENKQAVIKLQSDVEYIKDGIDDIKAELRRN